MRGDNEADDDDNEEFDEDEFDDLADTFESSYNFRFEEPYVSQFLFIVVDDLLTF